MKQENSKVQCEQNVVENETWQTLVEENHRLIWGFLHKHYLDEEWWDLGAIGLCQAARSYDPERGAFGTYAYRCMYNLYAKTTRKPVLGALSMSTPLVADNENFTIGDTIASTDTIDTQAELSVELKSLLKTLGERDLRILSLRLKGYEVPEIASRLGYTRQGIHLRLKKMYAAVRGDCQLYSVEGKDDINEIYRLRKEIVEQIQSF